jgi:hypothetical protein
MRSIISTCRKPLALKQDVEVQLDEQYSVKFTRSYELQLFFSCEGCLMGLSLLHGAMLHGTAEAGCLDSMQQHGQAVRAAGLQGSAAAGGVEAGAGTGTVAAGTSSSAEVAKAAAAAAAASEGTQDLLARARALMAADFPGGVQQRCWQSAGK